MGETEVWISLCFKAATATDGRQLIPYKTENDQWWGNTRYANEVMSYTKARAEGFQIPQIDLSDVSHQFWYQRGRNAGYALAGAAACWLILSVLQALVGWVVRGFLGIPRGMDRRPQAEQIANPRAVAGGEDSLRTG